MEANEMDFNKLALKLEDKNRVEDFEDWTYGEMIALFSYYVGVTMGNFTCAPDRTQRVERVIQQYPKSAKARPMPVPLMMMKVTQKGLQRKAHPLDISPAISVQNFVSITLPKEKAAAVYTAPKTVTKVVAELQTGKFDLTQVGELVPKVVCQYGVAAGSVDQEKARKQRVSAVCESLLVPGPNEIGLVPSTTATPEGFSDESLEGASVTLGTAFSGIEGKALPHQVYDTMVKDEQVYKFISATVGGALSHTVYKACLNESRELAETATAPKYKNYEYPMPKIVALSKGSNPETTGHVTSNVLDGLMVDRQLRASMNRIADVHIPQQAQIVYLDQTDRDLAIQVLRRESGKKLVVFYKALNYCENGTYIDKYFERVEKGNTIKYEVRKTGALPYYGFFVSPNPEITVYVNLRRSLAGEVTARTIENSTRSIMDKETRKFRDNPKARWFLISTHVYAMNPAFYVTGAKDVPEYGKRFYISRDFQSCNVLNSNYQIAGVTSFDQEAVLRMFAHVLRSAMSYPITRTPCASVEVQGEEMQLVRAVEYYPFSIKSVCRRALRMSQKTPGKEDLAPPKEPDMSVIVARARANKLERKRRVLEVPPGVREMLGNNKDTPPAKAREKGRRQKPRATVSGW